MNEEVSRASGAQARLEKLYEEDGRHQEDHPFHAVFTGLFKGPSAMGHALQLVTWLEDNWRNYQRGGLVKQIPAEVALTDDEFSVLRQAAVGAQNIQPLIDRLMAAKGRGFFTLEDAVWLRCYYIEIIKVFYSA